MTQSIDQVRQWLAANEGRTLVIHKEEDGRHDEAALTLEGFVFTQHHDTDDYLADRVLILKGDGVVSTASGDQPLPYDSYELSLSDLRSVRPDPHSLQLHTGRGSYAIEVES